MNRICVICRLSLLPLRPYSTLDIATLFMQFVVTNTNTCAFKKGGVAYSLFPMNYTYQSLAPISSCILKWMDNAFL